MLKKAIAILLLTLVFCGCRKKNERETLISPILDKKKHKAFVMEVAGKNFINIKSFIYKNTLFHAAKILLGDSVYKKDEVKIKKKLINIILHNVQKYLVLEYNEVLLRENIDNGINIRMRVVLKIFPFVLFFKKEKYKKLNVIALMNALSVIPFDNSIRIKMLKNPYSYLTFFKNKNIVFYIKHSSPVLTTSSIKLLAKSINKTLKEMGMNTYDYSNVIQATQTNNSILYLLQYFSSDYAMQITENTRLDRLANGSYNLKSILKFELYNSEGIKKNESNVNVDRIIYRISDIPVVISNRIKTVAFVNLFKDANQTMQNPVKFVIVFKKSPYIDYSFNFLKGIEPGIIVKKIKNVRRNSHEINVEYRGTRAQLQSLILNYIEKGKYKNKIFLTNSEKNVLVLTYMGVNEN